MNGYQFLYAVLITACLAFITWAALTWGSVIAIVFLAVLITLVLVGAGASIALLVQRMANEKSQQDFVNNARENLAMMSAMQKVQNLQSRGLMDQLGKTARLPDPAHNGTEPFVIDYDIFDGLED